MVERSGMNERKDKNEQKEGKVKKGRKERKLQEVVVRNGQMEQ